MVDDDGFNELVDVGLAGDLVVALWDGHQGGAEADGQVVGVHHVVLAVLGQAGRKGQEQSLRGQFLLFLLSIERITHTVLQMTSAYHLQFALLVSEL